MSGFTEETLDRPEIWKRALFMLLFAIVWGVTEVVITVVVLVQFVVVLFTGDTNEQLLRFGNSLAHYAYQIFSFLTFNTEELPFPMSAWPEAQDQEGQLKKDG